MRLFTLRPLIGLNWSQTFCPSTIDTMLNVKTDQISVSVVVNKASRLFYICAHYKPRSRSLLQNRWAQEKKYIICHTVCIISRGHRISDANIQAFTNVYALLRFWNCTQHFTPCFLEKFLGPSTHWIETFKWVGVKSLFSREPWRWHRL